MRRGTPLVTLFHDYTDAASAVAVARAQRLVDEGCAITFAGFEAVGVDTVLPVPLDTLAALDALAGQAAAEGVVLRRPSALPPTGRAHVVGALAEARGLGGSWRRTCYAAYWADDADLSSAEVLVELARRAGLDADEASAAVRDDAALRSMRREAAGHRRAGIGGVPVLRVDGTLIPGLLPEADLRALSG